MNNLKWNLAKLVRIKVKMVLMIVKLNSWEVLFLTVLKQNRKKETTLTYKTFNKISVPFAILSLRMVKQLEKLYVNICSIKNALIIG